MPVTTPIAKLIRKSFPKNFVSRSYCGLLGAHPGGLVAGDDRRQADRDRDEEEVVDGGDAELPPGDVQDVHVVTPRERVIENLRLVVNTSYAV